MGNMAATDHSGSRVSTNAAVYHPPLPPDYELDDYWMENIVLKDEKEAEEEFYSAFGHFTTEKLHPHPPYVAARIAAAPPYNPVSSLLTKSTQPHDLAFPTDNAAEPPRAKKNSRAENEKGVDPLGHHPKHKRSPSGYEFNSLSGSVDAAAPNKKNNQRKEMDDANVGVKNHKHKRHTTFNDSDYDYVPHRESEHHVKKQRLRPKIDKQKSSHPWSLSVKHTTTAAPAPPPWVHDQHRQEINDVPPVKSISVKTISAALPVLAVNHLQVMPDRELITILIAAKMGVCESLMLVMSKTLTCTDLQPGQNRLSIPHQQVQNDFLRPEEKYYLDCEKKSALGCNTIEVELLMLDKHQPCLDSDDENKVFAMNFTNWKTNSIYALKTNWKLIVQQYQLQVGTNVQLWAFRDAHSDLCFALLRN